jgi:hypothetical protein
MKIFRFITVACLLVSSSLAGETNQAERIVGTWMAVAGQNQAYTNEKESIYYTFRTNGTVSIWATVPLVKGSRFDGLYDIVGDRVIRLNIPSQGSREFDLDLTNSNFTMKDRVATNNWIKCRQIAEQSAPPLPPPPRTGSSEGAR